MSTPAKDRILVSNIQTNSADGCYPTCRELALAAPSTLTHAKDLFKTCAIPSMRPRFTRMLSSTAAAPVGMEQTPHRTFQDPRLITGTHFLISLTCMCNKTRSSNLLARFGWTLQHSECSNRHTQTVTTTPRLYASSSLSSSRTPLIRSVASPSIQVSNNIATRIHQPKDSARGNGPFRALSSFQAESSAVPPSTDPQFVRTTKLASF